MVAAGLGLLLSGCGATIGRMPLIGEPAHAPPPPAVTADYPAVGAGGGRKGAPMTPAERAKLEAELAAARANAANERRQKINQPSQ